MVTETRGWVDTRGIEMVTEAREWMDISGIEDDDRDQRMGGYN